MPLRLVREGEPLPPANPIPPLSPARERLAKHLADMDAARREYERLGAFQSNLIEAQRVLDDASEALEAVADLERAQWLAFVESGTRGPAPKPMDDERAQRAAAVAEATARRDIAQRQADAIAPKAREAWQRFIDLAGQRPDLIAAVLLEEGQSLAQRYEQALRQAGECELALSGLRTAMFGIDQGQHANDISNLLRLGNPNRGYGEPVISKPEANAIRARFISLADKLAGNARATAE